MASSGVVWRRHNPELVQLTDDDTVAAYFFQSGDRRCALVQSSAPITSMPQIEDKFYYFEASLVYVGERVEISVGLSFENYDLSKQPGWDESTWGYHSDDGEVRMEGETDKWKSEKFSSGDVIGCGLNLASDPPQIFFLKNGEIMKSLNVAARDADFWAGIYPSVGMTSFQDMVKGVFVKDQFVFKGFQHKLKLTDEKVEQTEEGHLVLTSLDAEKLVVDREANIVTCEKKKNKPAAVRSEFPLHRYGEYIPGGYFYEAEVLNLGRGALISFGLSGTCPEGSRHAGWDAGTVGFHGDDGVIFCGGDRYRVENPWTEGEILGVLLSANGMVAFYRNGELMYKILRKIIDPKQAYAMIGIRSAGASLKVRFQGERTPFLKPPTTPNINLVSPLSVETIDRDEKQELLEFNVRKTSTIVSQIRSRIPIGSVIPQSASQSLCYFEVTITEHDEIGIGFCDVKNFDGTQFPGWSRQGSYGFHMDDSTLRHAAEGATGYMPLHKCRAATVFGAGYDLRTKTIFFTADGQCMGPAFRNVTIIPETTFFVVASHRKEMSYKVNFGPHFVYKHPQLMIWRHVGVPEVGKGATASESKD
eukprot:TRINITY_DN12579_c0_g4_i1.p1 TRINITY_DN12579_c0_g4~~TRINITY_DN12579_c0_g4_i1.p1  ORF type:complete len:589 (+),score=149.02 TRINITY_DN12579_c0_g4_i1:43-1809(+)